MKHLKSLREYLDELRALGELQEINALVDWNLEMGAIIRRSYELRAPAPLFKRIKDIEPGFRVLGAPAGCSRRRCRSGWCAGGAGMGIREGHRRNEAWDRCTPAPDLPCSRAAGKLPLRGAPNWCQINAPAARKQGAPRMNSPFAGMDPHIEASGLWRNFHANLLIKIQDALADLVPPRYLVRAEERSYLALALEDEKEVREFYPDVRVLEREERPRKRGKRRPGPARVPETAVSTEQRPMKLVAFVENEVRETYIDVFVTEPERRLVTTIEVLSPTNKERGGYGWQLYLRKRQAALVCGVHLVEIDLLRGGTRLPMCEPWPASPYTLLVARARQQFSCDVWPAYFHVRLPAVPIPLAEPDADVSLPLQPLVDSIYRRLRYDESIDYDTPLDPPPDSAEEGWLREVRK
jgi:hypothetical protein